LPHNFAGGTCRVCAGIPVQSYVGSFRPEGGVTLGWQQGDDQSPTQQGRVGERLARRNDFKTIVCERSPIAKCGHPGGRARAKLSKQLEVRRRTSLFKLVDYQRGIPSIHQFVNGSGRQISCDQSTATESPQKLEKLRFPAT
jgi:hypothetical protein